jgi:hypothetical protein
MKLNDDKAKKNPFRVPEDYFDTLADRTMAAIREEEAAGQEGGQPPVSQAGQPSGLQVSGPGDAGQGKRGRVVSLRPFLALAAAILGFTILAAAMVRLISSDRQGKADESGTSLYAELAAEEIDMYILENELGMTEAMTEAVTPELSEEAVPSEAIIEYLMTEDIDLNEIYELL